MSKRKKLDRNYFERFCRKHGMRPVEMVGDATVDGVPVGDILLADSGDLIPLSKYPPVEGNEHNMLYFYRTGYAIYRDDKGWVGSFNDYPPDAFSEYDVGSRQGERVREALSYAAHHLKQTHDAGLYRGNDRIILH